VTAVDLVPFAAPADVRLILRDVRETDALLEDLGGEEAAGGMDLILSDLAPKLTGVRERDQEAVAALGRAVVVLARGLLTPAGALLLKTFHGEGGREVRAALAEAFAEVKTLKPPASRAESSEHYLLARAARIV
jgi:23S rRNA (uridine2552-2'-O)-methyltransferase